MLSLTKIERTLENIERSLRDIAKHTKDTETIDTFNTMNRTYALISGVLYIEYESGFRVYYDVDLETDELFDLLEKAELEIKESHPTTKINYIPVEISTPS